MDGPEGIGVLKPKRQFLHRSIDRPYSWVDPITRLLQRVFSGPEECP